MGLGLALDEENKMCQKMRQQPQNDIERGGMIDDRQMIVLLVLDDASTVRLRTKKCGHITNQLTTLMRQDTVKKKQKQNSRGDITIAYANHRVNPYQDRVIKSNRVAMWNSFIIMFDSSSCTVEISEPCPQIPNPVMLDDIDDSDHSLAS